MIFPIYVIGHPAESSGEFAMKKLLILSMAIAGMMTAGTVQATHGVAEKGKEKVAVCAGCHGADGNGLEGAPLNPKLADQVPGYIVSQLKAFKDGSRQDPIMAGMVAALTEDDMADIDAYYASLPVKNVGIKKADEEQALAGEKIYRGGFKKLNISACMSCHGPSGEGIPIQFPRVSGQNAAYTEKQHDMMNPISFLLSNEQITQLSIYMQGLK
jgi:cytochrome c553